MGHKIGQVGCPWRSGVGPGGILEGSWGVLRGVGGDFGGVLGVSGGSWGVLVGLGEGLGGSWGGLGEAFGGLWRAILSKAKISQHKIAIRSDSKPSWAHLGLSCGRLGALLGPPRGPLGPSWGHLGAILGHLGPSWGPLGGYLGPWKAISSDLKPNSSTI